MKAEKQPIKSKQRFNIIKTNIFHHVNKIQTLMISNFKTDFRLINNCVAIKKLIMEVLFSLELLISC